MKDKVSASLNNQDNLEPIQKCAACKEAGMLLTISGYATGLTRVLNTELFTYIASEMQRITGARAVVINEYDPEKKELVCRHSTLNDNNNRLITRLIGRAAVGMRIPVSDQLHHEIVGELVRQVDSLSKSTFGIIPEKTSTIVGKLFDINCYIGVALVYNEELIGTMLMVGNREEMISDIELLKPFVFVTSNAIELRAKELLLEQSREWYRTIAEDIPALVVRLSTDYTVTYANDAYCNFFGLPAVEITGSEVADYIPSEHYQRVIDHFKSLTPERPIDSHEHTNTAHDGSERWVRWTNRAIFDKNGEVNEYICIGEDITEQRYAFNLLQESEAMKSTIIEASPDVIFFQDSNGCFIDVISSGEKLLYLSRSEYIGRKLEDILPLEVVEEIKDAINEAVASGEL